VYVRQKTDPVFATVLLKGLEKERLQRVNSKTKITLLGMLHLVNPLYEKWPKVRVEIYEHINFLG
jgi:hypothetical protein